MKKVLIFLAVALMACQTSKKVSVLQTSTPLAQDAKVEVIGKGQQVPSGAKLLGHIKIGEGGATPAKNCTYDRVIADAQSQARAMGGNLIQVTQHKEPSIWTTTCHRIWCDVYKTQ